MTRVIFTSLLFVLSLFITNNSVAQQSYPFGQEWVINGYVGTTKFYGDCSDNTNSIFSNSPFSKYFYQDRRFGAGVYIDKKINPFITLRGTLLYASLKSTKESEKIYFIGDTYEYSLSVVVDFTNIFFGIDKYRPWNIYGFIGIGFTETLSDLYDLNTGAHLLPSGDIDSLFVGGTKKRVTETTMPLGIGINYKVERNTKVFFEFTRHIVHTNKLDAYPVEGTNFESFGLINIGISYDFNLPSHWGFSSNPRYNGKSTDPAIKAFNKKKRVVMNTKAKKRAMKKRKNYGRSKRKKHRW